MKPTIAVNERKTGWFFRFRDGEEYGPFATLADCNTAIDKFAAAWDSVEG